MKSASILFWSFLIVLAGASFGGSCQPPQDNTAKLLEELLQRLDNRSTNRSKPLDDPFSADNARSVGLGTAAPVTPPPPPPKPVAELRIYDLADLFAIAPSFDARGWNGLDASPLLGQENSIGSLIDGRPTGGGGGFGGMGGMGGGGMGGMFNSYQMAGSPMGGSPNGISAWQPTPTKLISLIESSIDADWESDGGNHTISWLGSSLVISTFPEVHAKIQKLLDLLQSRWNARVTFKIHLDWVWLNQSESKQLLSLRLADEAAVPAANSKAQIDEFLSQLKVDEQRLPHVHALLHGHNGQMVSWVSGSQKRTVADWTREQKGELSPDTATIHTGVACEVIPMLAHANSAITIHVRSRYVWRDLQDGIATSSDPKLPRPDADSISGQSIGATVRIPVGMATIVGGGSGVALDASDQQLYLIVSSEFVSPPERKK